MGRGSRGGRRAQTARQAANEAEGDIEETNDRRKVSPRGGGRGQDRGGNRGGRKNNQEGQDKNSWIYKYHNLERIQYEKVVFTADTEIPELPAAKDRLKEPSKAEFEREMTA